LEIVQLSSTSCPDYSLPVFELGSCRQSGSIRTNQGPCALGSPEPKLFDRLILLLVLVPQISRFKEKRAAETQLADLLAQKKNRLHVAGKRSGAGDAGSREEEEAAVGDDEEERRVWLLQIKAATHRAMDSLAALLKEEELLKAAPSPEEEGGQQELDARQKQAEDRHKRTFEAVQAEQAGGAAAGKGRTFVSVHTCGHQQPLYGPVSSCC
jgi:hypothetical protein